MNAHIKNDLKLRKLTLYIKAIEKEQIRPKDTRNKEMMKIKAEINEMDNRKKQKSWCFEMNNKIDKVWAKVRNRVRTQNQKWKRKHYNWCHRNKIDEKDY